MSRHGDAVIVRLEPESEVHFCIRRAVQPGEPSTVEAHLDWHGAMAGGEPLRTVHVYLDEGAALRYIGPGRCQMWGGAEGKAQYALRDLPPELDAALRPASGQGMGGTTVRERLEAGEDPLALAEALATSWLGALPDVPPPDVSGAPPEVRRWWALWSRLATFVDHPWCCWPAGWYEDELGFGFFQDEWQNGPTFGLFDGRVWMHSWATGEDHLELASSIGEFAVQFVILGLSESAHANLLYLPPSTAHSDVRPVGVTEWTKYFFSNLEFVGADDAIGTRSTEGTWLRCKSHDVALALSERASPAPTAK